MKNKHFFYHILMIYEIICSGLLIFLCIRIEMLEIVDFKPITAFVIIKQGFEILIYSFFFYKVYKTCKNYSLIKALMNLTVCMQFFFLGADFATEILGKAHTPLLITFLKILFTVYLIFCRRIRIIELNQKFNSVIDRQDLLLWPTLFRSEIFEVAEWRPGAGRVYTDWSLYCWWF